VGDVIVEVGGKSVATSKDVADEIAEDWKSGASSIALVVVGKGDRRAVTLPIAQAPPASKTILPVPKSQAVYWLSCSAPWLLPPPAIDAHPEAAFTVTKCRTKTGRSARSRQLPEVRHKQRRRDRLHLVVRLSRLEPKVCGPHRGGLMPGAAES
jgi:hypothetical protein